MIVAAVVVLNCLLCGLGVAVSGEALNCLLCGTNVSVIGVLLDSVCVLEWLPLVWHLVDCLWRGTVSDTCRK